MTHTTFSPTCVRPYAAFVSCVAIALLLAACGDEVPPTITAAPTQGGNTRPGQGFIATLIPLTEAPVIVTPTTASREITVVSRGSTTTTGTGTWTAPDGGISLRYPAMWRATPAMTVNESLLRLDGPNNQVIFVNISTSDANGPAPSPDEELQLLRDAQARSAQFTYTYGMTRDVTVGGAPARYLEYQYTPTANRTAVAAQGAVWAVQRGDRTYVLRASNIGAGRADVDAIIASVSYPPIPTVAGGTASSSPRSTGGAGTGVPALTPTAPLVRGTAPSQAPSTVARTPSPSTAAMPMAVQQGPATFADPDKRVTFQFPSNWKFLNPNGDAATFFEFDGPDDARFFVGINDGGGSLDDAVRAYRDTQRQIMVFMYMDGGVTDAQVGGEPGKLVTYTYVPQGRPGDPPRNGAAWVVIRGGKVFTFDARDIGAHRVEIDAMVSSIHFTK